MNLSEGLRRMATVIRWLGYLIAAGCLIGALNAKGQDYWAFLIAAAFFGGLGWVVAWIIEGFGKES